MCRLLCVKADTPFAVAPYLERFAQLARRSPEYQGHGWGYAWRTGEQWRFYRNVQPIWEDNLQTGVTTSLLLVHARSAFENAGISVDNNMPFTDGRWVFLFNGELRGVRLRMEGRIGAEKIFHLIRSRNSGDMSRALSTAMTLLEQRTAYLKAANIVLPDGDGIYIASRFNENPGYYTMWRTVEQSRLVICSEALDNSAAWRPVSQGAERVA